MTRAGNPHNNQSKFERMTKVHVHMRNHNKPQENYYHKRSIKFKIKQ